MNKVNLTFEGPHVGEVGLPVDAFSHTLTGMQDAMRLMVRTPGRPPAKPGATAQLGT